MTHPVLGRALPVHFAMTDLAAWGFTGDPRDSAAQWDDGSYGPLEGQMAIDALHAGRAELIGITKWDFGFDLAAWRDWLLARNGGNGAEDFGYGHPFAASRVDAYVLEGLNRPNRASLETCAEQGWQAFMEKQSERVLGHLTDPAIRGATGEH